MKNVVIIIPARYQSSRFPGKPLAEIKGKSLIRRVWEKAAQALDSTHVYVATDSEKIAKHCEEQDMQVIMTSSDCLTGTDRLYEASQKVKADIYINVQGDEPLIEPQDILTVIQAAKDNPGKIINAMCPISDNNEFLSPNIPKVVSRKDGRLLYMSRAGIPSNKEQSFNKAYKQVCIYAFCENDLKLYGSQKHKTSLENIEDIEILRFLELGKDVHMVEVSSSSVAVDVPEDIQKVKDVLTSQEKET